MRRILGLRHYVLLQRQPAGQDNQRVGPAASSKHLWRSGPPHTVSQGYYVRQPEPEVRRVY